MMNGPEQKVMHQPAIPKAHLVLLRVHIDINAAGIKLEQQHKRRMTPAVEHVPVGLANGMSHQPVFYQPPADKEKLQISLAAGTPRARNPPAQAQAGMGVVHFNGLLHECIAADRSEEHTAELQS